MLRPRRSRSQTTQTGLNSITMASFALFLFTILLLPVARSEDPKDPITCSECFNDKGGSCTGELKNCEGEEKCLSVFALANLSTRYPLNPLFSRTCGVPSNNSIGYFSFDFGNTLDFTSEVCDKKKPDCQPEFLGQPNRPYENGRSCPRCFRTGYADCDADGEVLCRGELVDCTDMNGEITHKYPELNITRTIPFAGKGCASRSVCDLGGNSFHFGTFKFTFKNLKCSEANGALSSLRRLAFTLEMKDLGPQVAFFLPCILGVFAVKILS